MTPEALEKPEEIAELELTNGQEKQAIEAGPDPLRMTQKQIHEYLIAVCESGRGKSFLNFMDKINVILPPDRLSEYRDEKGESNWDRAYRELPELYRLDYEFGHALCDFIGQDGHMIKTEVMMGTTIDALCKGPQYAAFVEDSLVHINGAYSRGASSERFINYLKGELNFEDQSRFEQIGRLMDILIQLFNIGRDFSWSNVGEYLDKVLEEAVRENKGSYLLNVKAKEILFKIGRANQFESYVITERDRERFKIVDGYEAVHDENGELQVIMKGSVEPVSVEKILPGQAGQEKNGLIKDYSYMMRPQMRRLISKEFGLDLTKLGFGEQIYFLDFIKSKPIEEVGGIQSFIKEYGSNGLRTFLSLEHGKELGDSIVEFGNSVDPELAKEVFIKYGEIVDAANKVAEYVQQEFGEEKEYSPELLSQISDKMLRSGRNILEQCIAEAQDSADLPRKVIEAKLEKARADIVAFNSSFKALHEAGVRFDLSDVRDLDLSTKGALEISKGDRESMELMYRENYNKYPKLAEYLVGKFDEALHQPSSEVSILRRDGEIVAFYRLEPTGQGNALHFGSFNVDPTYQGSSLGESLMQESLDVKAKDNIIYAECNPRVAVSANYIERGFIAASAGHIEEIDTLNIVRNDSMNKELESRSLTIEDIRGGETTNENIHIRTVPINQIGEYSFDFVGKRKGDKVEVLTRYIRDKNAGKVYLVTENVSSAFLESYEGHREELAKAA